MSVNKSDNVLFISLGAKGRVIFLVGKLGSIQNSMLN